MKERVKGKLSNEMSAMQPVDLNGKGKSNCKTPEPSPFFGTKKEWTRVLLISLVLEVSQLSCYPCCGLWLCAKVFQHPPAVSYACSRTTRRYSFQKFWSISFLCKTSKVQGIFLKHFRLSIPWLLDHGT